MRPNPLALLAIVGVIVLAAIGRFSDDTVFAFLTGLSITPTRTRSSG